MTKLDASHVLPIGAPESSREAYIRQKILPAPSSKPPMNDATGENSKASFAGRWVVVTELGDCIVDHVVSGCPEEIRKIHLKTVCALVASVFQFVVDISNQGHAVGTMHALALSSFKILVFRCSSFSVAAVVSKSAKFEAATQYKAQEVAIALKERIGEALTKVVGQLQSNNDAKMHSFTLESMLDADEGQNKMLLDPKSQGVSESVFQEKLGASYGDFLYSIIGEPQAHSPNNAFQACVCDDCGRLLTLLTKEDGYSREHSSWDHGSKWLYSTAQKLRSLPSGDAGDENIFAAPSSYAADNVLSKVDADNKSFLSLWFWAESGSTTRIIVGMAGPLRICIQLEDSLTGVLPMEGNTIVVSSPSLKIAQLDSEEQPALSLQFLGNLENVLYNLSTALGAPQQKPIRFQQHASAPSMQSTEVAVQSRGDASATSGYGPRDTDIAKLLTSEVVRRSSLKLEAE